MPGVTDGTEYTDSAIQTACRVMEGAKVRLNHPDRKNPHADRPAEHGLGVLRNCRPTSTGVRAEFHYNRANPFNAQLVEDVKRRMGQWGFSPNAVGVGQVRGGVYVVEELAHVRSVDLVSDPATTVNLWESQHRGLNMPCTFRDLCESALPMLKNNFKRRAMVSFLEMDYMADDPEKKPGEVMEEDPASLGDVPVEPMDAGAADPMEALTAGFQSAAQAVVQGVFDGSMDMGEATKKLGELFKTHAKLTTGAEPAPAVTAESEDEDAKEDEEKAAVEESKKELANLRAWKASVELCESRNYRPSKLELDAMVTLTEAKRADYVKELVAKARPVTSHSVHRIAGEKPRATGKPLPTTVDEFVSRLKG